MTSTSAALDQASSPIAALAPGFSATLLQATDDEVGAALRQVEELGRLVDTLRIVAAAEVAHRSRRELGTEGMAYRLGCVKPAHLIERVTLVSQDAASRRIRLGTAIRPQIALSGELQPADFPAVATALIDGSIGVDSANFIAKYLGDARRSARPEALAEAELLVVEFARTHSANLVKEFLMALQQLLDPDGIEPRDAEARALRSFWIREDRTGMTIFGGRCSPIIAGLIRAILSEGANPKAQPRFLPEEELAEAGTTEIVDEDGTVHTKIVDPRTRHLENGTGAGWVDDVAEPVGAATVAQQVCDGGATPIVLGKAGQVLYLGTLVRLFSAAQRKALAVRDGGCVWPSCTAPPSWCEAHHVIEYKKRRENGHRQWGIALFSA